ncbi:MAG: hypothetical protein PHQ03_10025 [Methylococcales bacterium]|nr:hypothetical protein [Methylococcales bacterium]
MKFILFTSLIIFALSAQAADKRIYSTNTIGNRQYDKPSYTITDNGRIYETDSIGNKRYDKQSYRIEGDKIFPTDFTGRRQYDKPAFEMK